MDNNKRNDRSVDDILEELKKRDAAPAGSEGRSVDDILAELGKGGDKPGPLVPPARPAPKAPPAEAPIVQEEAPPPALQEAAMDEDPAPVAEAPVVVDTAEEAPAPPAQEKPRKKKGQDLTATIWDIELDEMTEVIPRTGKAAALDKVDPDKFRRDSEFLSWFSDEDATIPISKKELKKAEKDRKRRAAAEQRAEAQRLEDAEEDLSQTAAFSIEVLEEDLADEAPPPKPRRAAPAWDDEMMETSAFDTPPGTWEPDEDFFTDAVPEVTAPFQVVTPPPAAPATPAAPAAGVPRDALLDITSAFSLPDLEEVELEAGAPSRDELDDTRSFNVEGDDEKQRVPTAAFTQEFDTEDALPTPGKTEEHKSLFVDEMVDDRFRDFFSETVIVDQKEIEQEAKARGRRKKKKGRSAILTGEFAKLAEQAELAELAAAENLELEDAAFDDYDRPQDAEAIEGDIASLRTTLTRRIVFTGVIALVLLWQGLAFAGALPLPQFMSFSDNPLVFAGVYLALVLVAIAINFTTVATGLVGLAGEATVDTPPALAALAGLLQGVLLLVQVLGKTPLPPTALYGGLVALVLCFNAFGKRVRAVSILRNFQLASAGLEHSAAYVLDASTDVTYNIVQGLQEEYPTLLVNRPTALVKGFLRQSFSQRASDRKGRILGWVLLGTSLLAAVLTFVFVGDLFSAISAFAATLCIGAPFSSTLVSGVPSLLLQQTTARFGAVVPGWSAIEELGGVNVVMASAKDIFPPSAVSLRGIKTFEKERIDLAILYAASVLIEGCDTLRDIFVGVIQGKSDMLYKVESLTLEPGRGFTAWVENSRVVIGSREMLQKHAIAPPPMELEVKHVPAGHMPVYLAVSGKLVAMFIVAYGADYEVQETLDSLVKSGVSLLIRSDDMNVTEELIERAYGLPPGVVKVLGQRELDILEPLTAYLPESEGVMTHQGTFASFIGGMRAAAGCAASERMSSIVQIASVLLACVLCLVLVFSGGLGALSLSIVLLYQLGWTLLVGILPFARRY